MYLFIYFFTASKFLQFINIFHEVLWQMLTDFNHSLTVGLCSKYAARPQLHFPTQLKDATSLSCWNFCCRHARLSPSHWRHSWVCPSWGKQTWRLSILGWRLMTHTTVMCSWLDSAATACCAYFTWLTVNNAFKTYNMLLTVIHITIQTHSALWQTSLSHCLWLTNKGSRKYSYRWENLQGKA